MDFHRNARCLPPDRFEACSVWVEGIHAEDSDPVLQKFRGHVSGEIWVAEVGIGS